MLLGLGALFVLFIYCLVWPVIKILANHACSPFLYPNILELVYPSKIYLVLICELWDIFIKLITSFSYLHSWWMKVVHCTLPWCLWHESFYGTHTNVPDHVVPWCGSKSHPQHQSPKAFLLFCNSLPLLPVGQEQNSQCLPFPLLWERTPLCHWNSRM